MLIIAKVLQMLRALTRQPERERNRVIGLAGIWQPRLRWLFSNQFRLRIDTIQPELEPERRALHIHIGRQANDFAALPGGIDRNQRVDPAADLVARLEDAPRVFLFLCVRSVHHRSVLRSLFGGGSRSLGTTVEARKSVRLMHLSTWRMWKLWIGDYERMLTRAVAGKLMIATLFVVLAACSKDEEARQEMRHLRFQQLEIQERANALTPRQRQLVGQITKLMRTTPGDERKLDSLLDLATR